MGIRALKYFVAAFEEQSISAAAKRSYVAQPSISSAISDLEAKLGVSLFIRHPRGVTPTVEGRELYDAALQVLGGMSAIEKMFVVPGSSEPPMTLAVMPSIDVGQLMKILKNFSLQDGAPTLRLVELSDPSDARIISERMIEKGEHFTALWRDQYVLGVPLGHPLTLKNKIALGDLDGLPFIERCSCESLGEVMAILERHKIQPNIVAKAKSEEWAAALVASGVGCALIPANCAALHKEIQTLVIDEFQMERTVGIARHKDRTPPRSLQRFLASLQDGSMRWKFSATAA